MNRGREHTIALIRTRKLMGIKPPRRKVPRATPPTSVVRDYTRALLALVRGHVRPAFAELFRELPDILADAARDRQDSTRTDAGEGERVRRIIDRAKGVIRGALNTKDIKDLGEKFAQQTSTHQRIQLAKQTQAALGADVFISDRRIPALAEAFIDANVGLVANIGDKVAADIEAATMRAIQGGTLHGDLAKELEEKLGLGEDRCKLIARDQVGKLYGQITSARHREMGVTRFIWRSVGDERVRDEHQDFDGNTYEYDDPPEGELPGEPILCRCNAEPVFDDLLSEAED